MKKKPQRRRVTKATLEVALKTVQSQYRRLQRTNEHLMLEVESQKARADQADKTMMEYWRENCALDGYVRMLQDKLAKK